MSKKSTTQSIKASSSTSVMEEEVMPASPVNTHSSHSLNEPTGEVLQAKKHVTWDLSGDQAQTQSQDDISYSAVTVTLKVNAYHTVH